MYILIWTHPQDVVAVYEHKSGQIDKFATSYAILYTFEVFILLEWPPSYSSNYELI